MDQYEQDEQSGEENAAPPEGHQILTSGTAAVKIPPKNPTKRVGLPEVQCEDTMVAEETEQARMLQLQKVSTSGAQGGLATGVPKGSDLFRGQAQEEERRRREEDTFNVNDNPVGHPVNEDPLTNGKP